jgi:uncharacterized membrane protein
MESKTRMIRHQIHPTLVPFPLGLLVKSVIFDVVHVLTGAARWVETFSDGTHSKASFRAAERAILREEGRM